MPVDDIAKMTQNVGGWLSEHESRFLYEVARKCKGRGMIVEIGSWKGKSTIWLAYGSKAGTCTPVYAIDPHTGAPEQQKEFGEIWTFDEFKMNLQVAGVSEMVCPIVMTSEEAAKLFDKPVEVIFIDGSHEYEMVKLDFEIWFPKVIDGGIMAFHDTIGHDGPRRVAKEYLYKSRSFRSVGFVDTISYGVKASDTSTTDQLRNRCVLMMKYTSEIGQKMHLPRSIQLFARKVVSRVLGR